MKLKCGCTPDASGYGYCSECTRKLREKIWANMSERKKSYDRHFDTAGSKALDDAVEEYDTVCTCHINPPCSHCVSKGSEDE